MSSPRLDGAALVLGASSGFGAAVCVALARAGMDVAGVHLDRRSTLHKADEVREAVRAHWREAWFFNVNAADDAKREATLDALREHLDARGTNARVLVHSLAFGSLRRVVAAPGDSSPTLTRMQVEMTLDVMASSLLYWTQGMLSRGMLRPHGRVFAMTSEGARRAWPGYGAVGVAKAALEAMVRQLAVEGAGHGFTANALCAGAARTPAVTAIPDHEALLARALASNPHGRLTTPDDVARAVVALSLPETDWINGNVIRVDGGESAAG